MGESCSQIGGVSVKVGEDKTQLCVIPKNLPYQGLVTYPDGRVADLEGNKETITTSDSEGKTVTADTDFTEKMKGAEIGDCNGGVLLLQDTYEGQPLQWTVNDLKEIQRLFGQKKGQSKNAFFCSNREDARRIGLNSDGGRKSLLMSAIKNIEIYHDKHTLNMDELHYNALVESLYNAAGIPLPKTWKEKAVDYLIEGVKWAFGLVGVAFAFGRMVHWFEKRKGPPNDGPGGGSGVGYKGAGGALLSADGGLFAEDNSVTSPNVSAPNVSSPRSIPGGGVVMPNAVPAPRVVPELVPVVP